MTNTKEISILILGILIVLCMGIAAVYCTADNIGYIRFVPVPKIPPDTSVVLLTDRDFTAHPVLIPALTGNSPTLGIPLVRNA